jgi:hypothetical protein
MKRIREFARMDDSRRSRRAAQRQGRSHGTTAHETHAVAPPTLERDLQALSDGHAAELPQGDVQILQRQLGNQALQRAVTGRPGGDGQESELSDDMRLALASERGRGEALPPQVLTQMEGAFGTSFGGVSVHNDAKADELSASLSARAFTVGSDVYFAEGQYQPTTREGQRVLAHELTHVVQQGSGAGGPSVAARAVVGAVNDPAEAQARAISERVVEAAARQEAVLVPSIAQRQEEEDVQTLRRQEYPGATTHRTLRRGSTGPDVEELQRKLNGVNASLHLVVDGIFGQATYDAVVDFQIRADLEPDGVVGPRTWEALDAYSTGQEVTDAELERLVALHAQGQALYSAHDYAGALAIAMQIYADPVIEGKPLLRVNVVWNIAACHHQLGNFAEAIGWYQEYLDTPGVTAPGRGPALENMRRCRLHQRPPIAQQA